MRRATLGLSVALLAVACSGGAPQTPTNPPPTATPVPPTPTAAPVATATPAATVNNTAPSLDAPAELSAGSPLQVAWTGPNAQGDYVTIVAAGATKWTNEPYFYTTAGSPGNLVAPTKAGAYELWYVNGADEAVVVRRPITVTPFVGSLSGPASVEAGTTFSVEWTGPNASGDYVTIVATGATKWTNEPYFYTASGTPGNLIAPTKAGTYELWYVAGADDKIMTTAPITVSALSVTLSAPASVNRGAQFEVTWTGPNGPTDYITIAPATSPSGTYLSYAYTSAGSPATLTAPDDAGAYEIRYESDRVEGTFGRIAIEVK